MHVIVCYMCSCIVTYVCVSFMQEFLRSSVKVKMITLDLLLMYVHMYEQLVLHATYMQIFNQIVIFISYLIF